LVAVQKQFGEFRELAEFRPKFRQAVVAQIEMRQVRE